MFFEKQPKVLKEEKMVIATLWKQHRKDLIDDLSEPGELPPTDEEVKEYFDFLIQEARKEGMLKRILDKYLQLKIEKQRERELGHR